MLWYFYYFCHQGWCPHISSLLRWRPFFQGLWVLAVIGLQLSTSAKRIVLGFQELRHLEMSIGCALPLRQASANHRLIHILDFPVGSSWDQTSPGTTCLLSFFPCSMLLFSLPDRFLLKTLHSLPNIPISCSASRDPSARHHLSGIFTLSFTSSHPDHVWPSSWLLTHLITLLLTMLINWNTKSSLVTLGSGS